MYYKSFRSNMDTSYTLFKRLTKEALDIQLPLAIMSENKIESLLSYLGIVNTYLFFSVENLVNIANYINDDLDARSFIMNLTDTVLMNYIGHNGEVVEIVNDIVTMVNVTKNISKDRCLYDHRLSDSLRFDEDKLGELLSNNMYLIVIYQIVLNPDWLVGIAVNQEDK